MTSKVVCNLPKRTIEVHGNVSEKYARKLCNDFMRKEWLISMEHGWVTNPRFENDVWYFELFSSQHDVIDMMISSFDPNHKYIKELVNG